MKENDSYCGFLCSDITERQQKIVDDIKDFSEYNPEFALEMMGRIMEIWIDGHKELTQKLPKVLHP